MDTGKENNEQAEVNGPVVNGSGQVEEEKSERKTRSKVAQPEVASDAAEKKDVTVKPRTRSASVQRIAVDKKKDEKKKDEKPVEEKADKKDKGNKEAFKFATPTKKKLSEEESGTSRALPVVEESPSRRITRSLFEKDEKNEEHEEEKFGRRYGRRTPISAYRKDVEEELKEYEEQRLKIEEEMEERVEESRKRKASVLEYVVEMDSSDEEEADEPAPKRRVLNRVFGLLAAPFRRVPKEVVVEALEEDGDKAEETVNGEAGEVPNGEADEEEPKEELVANAPGNKSRTCIIQ